MENCPGSQGLTGDPAHLTTSRPSSDWWIDWLWLMPGVCVWPLFALPEEKQREALTKAGLTRPGALLCSVAPTARRPASRFLGRTHAASVTASLSPLALALTGPCYPSAVLPLSISSPTPWALDKPASSYHLLPRAAHSRPNSHHQGDLSQHPLHQHLPKDTFPVPHE